MSEIKRITITMAVEESTLRYIDKAAEQHQMSRTGFMVYSSLKYAKEQNIEGDNGTSNS